MDQLPSDILPWDAVIDAIRERALDERPENGRDLNEWADFLEGCEQLRRQQSSPYQKKS